LNPQEFLQDKVRRWDDRIRSLPGRRRLFAFYRRHSDRLLTPFGRSLVGAGVIVGLLAVNISEDQTHVLWSVLFGIGLASFLSTRFGRKIRAEVTRILPARATSGSELRYVVKVTNVSERDLEGFHLREEDLPRFVFPLLEQGRGPRITRLPAGGSVSVELGVRLERRGIHDLTAVRADRICPFGLTRSGSTVPCGSRLVVLPRSYPVNHVDFTQARVYQPGGVPLAASVGESSEFVGLRDYRSGDPLRHISWKAWARSGKPVVREFQGEYFRRVALVLDTALDPEVMLRRAGGSYLRAAENDPFEAAVSAAASVTGYFERNEYVIDLFAAGDTLYYLQAGLGLSHMEQVLDLLSCVEPTRGSSLPVLDDALCRIFNQLSGLVLVTTAWRDELKEYYAKLVMEVPEVKVILVSDKGSGEDPADVIVEPRLYRRIRPAALEEDLLEL
jgi:uncharacterized protein (DUF58 family)